MPPCTGVADENRRSATASAAAGQMRRPRNQVARACFGMTALRRTGTINIGAMASLAGAFALFALAALLIVRRQVEFIRLDGLGTLAFRDIIYYPVRAFLEGVSPYDAERYLSRYPAAYAFPPYLPSTLLIHLPFGLLPLGISAVVYDAVLLGLTVLLAFVALRLNGFRASAVPVLLVAALVLFSPSGRENFFLGEVTLQVALAAYLALAYARRKPWISGLGLAVTAFKPTYALPLGLLMLARGDRRAVALGVALALVLNLLVVGALVHDGGSLVTVWNQFQDSVRGFEAAILANDPARSPYRIDGIALIGRVVGHSLSAPQQALVSIGVLAIAAMALRSPILGQPNAPVGLSAGVILTAVLLGFYHQRHDPLVLTLPLVALARRPLAPSLDGHGLRWFLLAPLIVLFCNYAGGYQVLNRLGYLVQVDSVLALAQRPQAVLLASLNGAALVALLLAYVYLAIRATRLARATPDSVGHAAAVPLPVHSPSRAGSGLVARGGPRSPSTE